MKLIIAGSRFDERAEMLDRFIAAEKMFLDAYDLSSISETVSGAARGYDRVGERISRLNGIPVRSYPANWDKYGKAAGYIRNAEMADYADELLAFWDGHSRGTKNMIDEMHKRNKPVKVFLVP